jgi:hypothetical protein
MPSATISGAGYSADILDLMRLLRRFEVRCVIVRGEAVIFLSLGIRAPCSSSLSIGSDPAV